MNDKPTTRLRALWSDAGYMTVTEAGRVMYPDHSPHYQQMLVTNRARGSGVYRTQQDAGNVGHFVPKTWVQVRRFRRSLPDPIEVTYG